MLKVGTMGPDFAVRVDVTVIKRKVCTLIVRLKLRVLILVIRSDGICENKKVLRDF